MSNCDWCGAPGATEVTVEPARYRRTRHPHTGLIVDECTRLAIKAHACPTHARLVRDEAQPQGGSGARDARSTPASSPSSTCPASRHRQRSITGPSDVSGHQVKHEVRWCLWCGGDIPDALRPHALFCSRSHAVQASAWRKASKAFWTAVRRQPRRRPHRVWRTPRSINPTKGAAR